jgi:site-specific DNA-methyltransferase (adenine-specific)
MPLALLERIVRVSSNPGDLVLDPFAGSGTTLAAAKKLGRDYYGIELSENYVERIRDRLKRLVGYEDVRVDRTGHKPTGVRRSRSAAKGSLFE